MTSIERAIHVIRSWPDAIVFSLAIAPLALAACASDSSLALLDDCGAAGEVAVPWSEPTELGTSPARAFADKEATCTAAFSWNGSAFTALEIAPRAGATTMRGSLTLDRQSARVRRSDSQSSHACAPALAVDAQLQLTTEAGEFMVGGQVTLQHPSPALLSLHVDSDAHRGSIRIGSEPRSDLVFLVSDLGADCRGRVLLNERPARGDGLTDVLATWSNHP